MKFLEAHWWVILAILALWYLAYTVKAAEQSISDGISNTLTDLDPIPDTTQTSAFSFWQWLDQTLGIAQVQG